VSRDFLDPKVLSRLTALPLFARSAMLGNVTGMHRSPVRGSSLEFAQYRKYVPGDDIRRLDWRAWGRSDRYFIKEFEADTNLRLVLLVDVSGSMAYGPEQATRLDYARRLAGTLGWLAARQGDAVGLWASAGTEHRKGAGQPVNLPARRGATHLGLVLDSLGDLKAAGGTSLIESLHEAAERVSQRAQIVILSDLFTPAEELRTAIQHLRFRKHDVSVFHLLDQRELDFDFDRPARFVDLEGGEPILADPDDVARAYRQAVTEWLVAIDEIVRTTAIDYHRVKMHEDYSTVLARYLLGRTPKRAGRR
jgi:uncharacterized protein (DUF58 family)